jgi:diguanylate cyclase (GGDEF)-like protein/PAS domain S-box-containing protein
VPFRPDPATPLSEPSPTPFSMGDPHDAEPLRRGDLLAIRLIVAMEAVATLVFGVLHRMANPAVVDPLWQRLALTAVCAVVVALTFRVRGRGLVAFLYLLYYAYTAWAIELLLLNRFDPDYAVGAIVVIASVCVGFLDFAPLRWYLAVTLCATAAVFWQAPPAADAHVHPPLYVAYLGLFSALGYLVLRGRMNAQQELAASRAHYALTAQAANDGLWDWDLTSGRVHYSPRWKSMLGLAEDAVGESPEEWLGRVHPDDAERVRAELVRHWEGGSEHLESEFRILRGDEEYAWVLVRGLALRDARGKAHRMAGSQTDITDRKRTEEQLLHEALHDPLTGLPNRALLLDRLRQVFRRRLRNPEAGFAVLFVDLDRFKVINDSLGHAAGDELLTVVTRRLKSAIRLEDTVARIGGDEFAVVLADLPGDGELARIVARIHLEIATPVRLREREVVTTASIGIAIGPEGYVKAEDMLRDADLAMYRAKSQGPGQYVLFDQAMQSRTLAALEMETDLRRAIELGELRLQYQPIVSLPDRQLTGFEALVRWHRPGYGPLAPAEFIPLAEQTGLIVGLGRWVLREACRQMQSWQETARTDAPLAISVNVSGRQLTHPGFVADVSEALQASGLQPQHLRLELTESILLSDPDAALSVLARLHDLGVLLHLDDFGTGYSSFSYLHRFPIDAVKIDGSFVKGMDTNPRNAAIVRTLVVLAQTLGVSVLAEGVETTEEFAQLEEIQCPGGQGFLFAPPLDAADAEALLRSTADGERVLLSDCAAG